MAFDMMYSHQRKFFRIGDGFGFRYADKESAYQAWAVGDAYGVKIIKGYPCFRQGSFHHLINFFDVFSGGDFRNHPSVQFMEFDLRRNHI